MNAKVLSLNECKRVLETELRDLQQVEAVVIEHPILWKGLLSRREQIHEDLRWIKFMLNHIAEGTG